MLKSEFKVAIVHDVFVEQGGAERVLLIILSLFPGADVYTPLMMSEAEDILLNAGARKVISSKFNAIPFIHSASILLKPLLFWYWESLNLTHYDLVISSSHSFSSKAVRSKAGVPHISYIHTSPRYLYAEFNETRIIKKPIFRELLTPLMVWLRRKDYLAAQHPDVLVANSKEVQRRIKKYYRRDAELIYPPVNIPQVLPKRLPAKGQYYVCFSRLAKQKGIDLAVRACTILGKSLKVVGEGSEREYLASVAGRTVEFLGRVPDQALSRIFAGAKAMIYPSLEEDFGMAPVEAMAAGVPVIAHRSGGVVESVIEGKTGLFFDNWTVEGVIEAIERFEKKHFSAAACRKQAKRFATPVFRQQFMRLVSKWIKK